MDYDYVLMKLKVFHVWFSNPIQMEFRSNKVMLDLSSLFQELILITIRYLLWQNVILKATVILASSREENYMLLILRHLESSKNTFKKFSAFEDSEGVTEGGLIMGSEIARCIAAFVDEHAYDVSKVYCANSMRARETARIIADKLGVNICALDELRSNNSGVLQGKSETEANVLNPLFMKQLKLFRTGIYSSYDFISVFERENKHDFEKRVNGCLEKIIAVHPETLKIVVLHHSSLTAAIIYFARKFYNYPENFYGHVACELGNIYLISDTEIVLCNEPASALKDVRIL